LSRSRPERSGHTGYGRLRPLRLEDFESSRSGKHDVEYDKIRSGISRAASRGSTSLARVLTRTPASAGLRGYADQHSTLLSRKAEINIRNDPIWAERASPIAAIGRAACVHLVYVGDLPGIDVFCSVVFSDTITTIIGFPTLRKLNDRGQLPIMFRPESAG